MNSNQIKSLSLKDVRIWTTWLQAGLAYKVRIMLMLVLGVSSCTKLVDVDPPDTSLTSGNVYSTDATATAVLTGVYSTMSSTSFSAGYSASSIFMLTGLSADELVIWTGLVNNNQTSYYRNALAVNPASGHEFWNSMYPLIFTCNSVVEAVEGSNALTTSVRRQLLGEAKFLRAFLYFYLINLYGDVPLVLNTDFKLTATLSRTSKGTVLQQIVMDLKESQDLLSDTYVNGNLQPYSSISLSERVRPTKWAATALLSRIYLYMGDYINSEVQATIVINSSNFSITSLDSTFLKNNKEAIWQLQPVSNGAISNTADAVTYILSLAPAGFSSSHPVYLSPFLINSFELNDQRKVNGKWVSIYTDASGTYYYPYKYKVGNNNAPVSEYTTVLRLAEQYLIRAEARAQQGNLLKSAEDLNVIRSRAAISGIIPIDQKSLLLLILHERQVELFTEWGSRWLDLKRTNSIDSIMKNVTPTKGGVWSLSKQLYPIPLNDLQTDPNLTQNPGY